MTPRATHTMNRSLSQPPSLRKEVILLTGTIIIPPPARMRTMKRTTATTGTPVIPPK